MAPRSNDERIKKLREKGASKEKAARIANTPASKAGRWGGKASSYEDMARDELYDRAKDIGIEGRSNMNKKELISALRHHQEPTFPRNEQRNSYVSSEVRSSRARTQAAVSGTTAGTARQGE